MKMTNGNLIVTKWNETLVVGTDHLGAAFEAVAKQDGRGDAFFRLNGEKWFAKTFRTELPIVMQNMLDISTGHITKETNSFLQEQVNSGSNSRFIVYEKGDYGYFFPVLLEERDDLPQDLLRLLNYANVRRCSWVMLDRDGQIVVDLPFEDW